LVEGYARRPDALMQTALAKMLKLLAERADHTFSAAKFMSLDQL
jgi:hypothetical protein